MPQCRWCGRVAGLADGAWLAVPAGASLLWACGLHWPAALAFQDSPRRGQGHRAPPAALLRQIVRSPAD